MRAPMPSGGLFTPAEREGDDIVARQPVFDVTAPVSPPELEATTFPAQGAPSPSSSALPEHSPFS